MNQSVTSTDGRDEGKRLVGCFGLFSDRLTMTANTWEVTLLAQPVIIHVVLSLSVGAAATWLVQGAPIGGSPGWLSQPSARIGKNGETTRMHQPVELGHQMAMEVREHLSSSYKSQANSVLRGLSGIAPLCCRIGTRHCLCVYARIIKDSSTLESFGHPGEPNHVSVHPLSQPSILGCTPPDQVCQVFWVAPHAIEFDLVFRRSPSAANASINNQIGDDPSKFSHLKQRWLVDQSESKKVATVTRTTSKPGKVHNPLNEDGALDVETTVSRARTHARVATFEEKAELLKQTFEQTGKGGSKLNYMKPMLQEPEPFDGTQAANLLETSQDMDQFLTNMSGATDEEKVDTVRMFVTEKTKVWWQTKEDDLPARRLVTESKFGLQNKANTDSCYVCQPNYTQDYPQWQSLSWLQEDASYEIGPSINTMQMLVAIHGSSGMEALVNSTKLLCMLVIINGRSAVAIVYNGKMHNFMAVQKENWCACDLGMGPEVKKERIYLAGLVGNSAKPIESLLEVPNQHPDAYGVGIVPTPDTPTMLAGLAQVHFDPVMEGMIKAGMALDQQTAKMAAVEWAGALKSSKLMTRSVHDNKEGSSQNKLRRAPTNVLDKAILEVDRVMEIKIVRFVKTATKEFLVNWLGHFPNMGPMVKISPATIRGLGDCDHRHVQCDMSLRLVITHIVFSLSISVAAAWQVQGLQGGSLGQPTLAQRRIKAA
eukprot:Gb_03455 [translate_table: standard]